MTERTDRGLSLIAKKALRVKRKRATSNKTVKFSVSPLFVVYSILFVITNRVSEGVAYLTALVLHELAHAIEANKRGYELSKMKFTVFGAALCGRFDGMNSNDEISIAVAGPLSNAVTAVCCVALWWIFPTIYLFTSDFVSACASLCVFNLLPVYPLDGGRVAIALLSKRFNREKAYGILRAIGFAASAILIALFVVALFAYPNPSFLLMGIFIFLSSFFPDNTCCYQKMYRLAYRSERIKRGLAIKEIAVFSNMSVRNAERMLNSEYYTCFVFVDDDLELKLVLPETAFDLPQSSQCKNLKELAILYENSKKTN